MPTTKSQSSGKFIWTSVAVLVIFSGCSKAKSPEAPAGAVYVATKTPGLDELSQLAKSKPNDVATQLSYAKAVAASDPVAAVRALNFVLKLDAQNKDAATGLADIFELAGYTDRVIETLQHRLKAVPTDSQSRFRLARTLLSVRDTNGAKEQLQTATAGKMTSPEAMNEWISFYYITRESAEAVNMVRAWAALAPADPERLYRQSEIERAADKYVDAEATIKSAIKLNSMEGKFHRQLAHILLTSPAKDQRAGEAETESLEAIKLGDSGIDTKYWLAVAQDTQKKTAATIKSFEDVAAIDQTYERTAFRLGRLYQQQGRLDEGKKMLDFMEEMEKNQSRYSQALITLQNHPEAPDNHIAAARLQSYVGKPGISVTILKRARMRFPNDRHIKDELRQTLLDAGRKAEAGQIK